MRLQFMFIKAYAPTPDAMDGGAPRGAWMAPYLRGERSYAGFPRLGVLHGYAGG